MLFCPFFSISIFKCSSFTSLVLPVSFTPFVTKTGRILPGPNGPICSIIFKNLAFMSDNSISASISIFGINWSSVMVEATIVSNFSMNLGKFSKRMERPAAYLCPPNCSSKSAQAHIAACTSKP